MRLRTRIQAPERFEDEDHNTSAANNVTKPAFPRLLKEQTISFNPHLPPAAFPSLTHAHLQGDGDCMLDDFSELADADMVDIDWSLDHTFLPTVRRDGHLDRKTTPTTESIRTQDPPVLARSFLDDAETSDEEEIEASLHLGAIPLKLSDSNQWVFLQIQQVHGETIIADNAQSIQWTQLAPSLQVEIFENLCDSRLGDATYDILGLSRNELYDVMKHLWNRNKQITAEDHGIQQLQQAQLRTILRKDHSSSLTTNSWRDHVACTRRHLPYVSASFDYFICKEAEVELARKFLNERGIDTGILGEWGRNKDIGIINSIQSQVVQASDSRNGGDTGYTSETTQEVSRLADEFLSQVLPRNALLEISNSARGGVTGPVSLRRKQSQSIPEAVTDTTTIQVQSFGLSTVVGTSSASANLQVAGLKISLRARHSRLTPDYKNGVASMMKRRGGGLEELDASYEDENEPYEAQNSPQLKINPPKPPPEKQDLDVENASTSPKQRPITLKISPKNLEKLQTKSSSNVRLSPIRLHEVLTPAMMAITGKPISNNPKRNRPRAKQPMPAARKTLKSNDPGNLDAFSSKLLEIQRGAAGFYRPPAPSTLPSQQSDHLAITSPKRLKPNPPHDINLNISNDDMQAQTPHGSSQLKRNDSVSSQEAPPWSPITQASNNSRPPSRRESYKEDFQSYKISSANSSNLAFQPNVTNETQSIVPTAPQTPLPTKASYRRPSIAENGSPVLGLTYDVRNSSTFLREGLTYQEAKHKVRLGQVPGSSQSSEPPQTLGRLPSNVGTPSRESIFGELVSTDPLRTYATGLLQDLPNGLQFSPSRWLTENLVITDPTNPPTATKLGVSPPSVSPAEQSKIDAIFKSPKRSHAVGGKLDIQLSELPSKISSASSRKQSPTEEDESLTSGEASTVTKAAKALVPTTTALQDSPQAKTGKDGKVRPRTYIKSQKQMQKEAANAAAKATLGKSGVMGKKKAIEAQKTDEKSSVVPLTTIRELPASQTVAHHRTPLIEGGHFQESGPFVETQMLAKPKKNKFVEDLQTVRETLSMLPEAITASKQRIIESGDSKVAQKVKMVATDDESYEEDGTSDASIALKKIATPKGKKVAVDRAKAAIQGYQSVLARRGKSALTDMTSKKKKTPKPKTVDGQGETALKKKATSKPNMPTGQQREGSTRKWMTITQADEAKSLEATPLSQKGTLKTKVPSGGGDQSAPAKRKKKGFSLAIEGSVLTAEGEGRTQAFRGNQYLNANGTPRIKKDAGAIVGA